MKTMPNDLKHSNIKILRKVKEEILSLCLKQEKGKKIYIPNFSFHL